MKNNIDTFDEFVEIITPLLQEPKIIKMNEFIQHGDTSCLMHTLSVAYYSFNLAKKWRLKIDEKSLVRGAIFHDYFLYDWHDRSIRPRFHGFKHPLIALNNAERDFDLNKIEKDIILKHMFPLTFLHMPKHKESFLVCLADKIVTLKETRAYKQKIKRILKAKKAID